MTIITNYDAKTDTLTTLDQSLTGWFDITHFSNTIKRYKFNNYYRAEIKFNELIKNI